MNRYEDQKIPSGRSADCVRHIVQAPLDGRQSDRHLLRRPPRVTTPCLKRSGPDLRRRRHEACRKLLSPITETELGGA